MRQDDELQVTTLVERETHVATVRETGFVVIEVPVPVEVHGEAAPVSVTEARDPERVIVEESQVVVVAAGQQGPPGAPGGGSATASVFSLTAGPAGVSGHRAVMATSDGTAAHADPAEARAYVGISKHAAVAGAPVAIALRDTLTESSWAWVPGKTIYFTADGMLTQTVPTTTAVTPIGVALSATSILISRDNPVFLGA